MKAEYDAIKEKENRLAEIPPMYEEIFDSLTEEEKESDITTDTNDALIAKEVSKKIKELKNDVKSEENIVLLEKLTQYEALQKEEKDLKAQVKTASNELQLTTKNTIESLTDEQVLDLLEQKWIVPLVNSLQQMPNTIVNTLVNKINALAKKYEVTYYDLEAEIRETEQQLCAMIDELTGNEFDMKGLQELKALLGGV